jgi:hypothetical protein
MYVRGYLQGSENGRVVTIAEIYWGRLIFRAESSLIQSSCRSFIGAIVPYEISKVNFHVETKILVSMSVEI